MRKVLKAARFALPVSGVLVAVLGIILLFMTLDDLDSLAVFIGIAMVFSGFAEFVFFFKRDKDKRSKTMLYSGFIAVLLGAYTVFGRGAIAVATVLPFVFALWIISACVPRIKSALEQRVKGSPFWIFMFSFGALGVALGIFLMFSPLLSGFVVIYSLAFMFITHGVNTIVMFFKGSRKAAETAEAANNSG